MPTLPELTFPYTLRKSTRAKRLRVRVSAFKGVEVVVPDNVPMSRVSDFLLDKQKWIEKTISRLSAEIDELAFRPNEILLFGGKKAVSVVYGDNKRRKKAWPYGDGLLLDESLSDRQVCSALQEWLKAEAKKILPVYAARIAASFSIDVTTFKVKLQATRWGSCSTKGNINLNAALIFLPEKLIEYIIHHELAHIQHPNHSSHYWNHLQRMYPKALLHDAEMKETSAFLPLWITLR